MNHVLRKSDFVYCLKTTQYHDFLTVYMHVYAYGFCKSWRILKIIELHILNLQ